MKLLLLHGFGTTPAIWEKQKCLGGEAPQLNFENWEAGGEGLERGLGLVGWSMGGMAALQLAAKFPEKIKALVLVSTTPKFIRSPNWQFGLPLAILRRLQKRIKIAGINAFHSLIFDLNKNISGLADPPLEQIESELEELARLDLRAFLPRINMPTLIIHGERDEICLPGAADYMQKKIPNSQLLLFPGVGHAPMIEISDVFNARLKEFIADVG
ncbi:alpha/beta fold hydrolase [Candidatus Saganbacteria bacterium]|nr:alpha/beta fold hydrolase [Candidatus Saganbacteria bacterium]